MYSFVETGEEEGVGRVAGKCRVWIGWERPAPFPGGSEGVGHQEN